ncbi:Metal homeostasis factor ATX1, partial [Lachnellula suecica]
KEAHYPATMAEAVSSLPGGEHTYKFNVAMSCGGCSGAVNRVLGKLEGVKSHDVTLEPQQWNVSVVAEPGLKYGKVLKKIANTRKEVKSGEADGVVQSVKVEDFPED